MKKRMILLAMAAFALVSCDNNDDKQKPEPPVVDPLEGLVFVEGGINYIGDGTQEYEDMPAREFTLDASKQYVIRGWVHVVSGATINIPAGTIIKGSSDEAFKGSSLIVQRGGKIFAKGTKEKPIVFTSDKPVGQRKPGDWGGIIVLGKAPNNSGGDMLIEGGPDAYHGGNDPADNSGELSYVRIEYCGYPFKEGQEINGLTLGSVGSGTKLSHIQVSYANDDSFEWFGGTVNADHLVAYHGWDDDFDTDAGYSGRVQFAISVRHPKLGDTSRSNGFESDNNSNGTDADPDTKVQFSNVTFVGPIGQDPAFVNTAGSGNYITGGEMNPNNGSVVGQFQAAVQIRRNSQLSLSNAAIIGWPIGSIIENDKGSTTQTHAASRAALRNIVYGGYSDNAADAMFDRTATGATPILASDKDNNWSDVLFLDSTNGTATPGTKAFTHTYIQKTELGNVLVADAASLLENPRSVTDGSFTINASANYGPKAGSALLNSAFTVPSGFDASGNGFAGAFKSNAAADNWMSGWANLNPQNAAY